jgi:hypothetical protein
MCFLNAALKLSDMSWMFANSKNLFVKSFLLAAEISFFRTKFKSPAELGGMRLSCIG